MLLLSIFISLAIVGIIIYKKSYDDDYQLIGICMSIMFSIGIFVCSIILFTKNYNYEIFVIQRNTFEQTLNDARKSGNIYETVAIVKDVANWNVKLSTLKYDNKNIWFDHYIDDRIEDLKPIK